MASFGMSLLAGFLVAALCVQMGYARDDINNCPTAENCIRYDESGCNSEGERLVCISWQDQSGCQLTAGQDDVEDMCMENDVGRPAAVECSSAVIPTVTQATFTPPGTPTVPVGGRITYDCNLGFVLQTNTDATQQFITCTRDGSFSTPVSNCVPVTPVSCADYFSRNNRLATSPVACENVMIAPPTLLGVPMVSVQCCKESSTQISTQIPVSNAPTASLPPGMCSMGGDGGIGVTPGAGGISGYCGAGEDVMYGPLDSPMIKSVIATTANGCVQTVTNNCLATASSLALAVLRNGETVGDFYGTNIFTPNTQIELTPDPFPTDNCDCADGPTTPGTPCEGGCLCTKVGAVGTARSDTITLQVTSATPAPAYVTRFIVSTHNSEIGTTKAMGDFSTIVSPIICSETV